MVLWELFILALGLSMDAFAVSICKGLSLRRIGVKHMCIAGAWFGGFQALMPVIGYLLGRFFTDMIGAYDHWIAFGLLLFIGGKMLWESLAAKDEDDEDMDAAMDAKTMLILAIATSIDALAVGVTFAFLDVAILPAAVFIGCTTFVCSAVGVKVGSVFGARYKNRAEIIGGVALILIGLKILLEGLGVL